MDGSLLWSGRVVKQASTFLSTPTNQNPARRVYTSICYSMCQPFSYVSAINTHSGRGYLFSCKPDIHVNYKPTKVFRSNLRFRQGV